MSRIDRSMAILRWAMVVGAGIAAVYSVVEYGLPESTTRSDADPRFYCPMHPQIRSHDPGTCPICHMQLEPIPSSSHDHGATPPNVDAGIPAGLAPVEVALERQQQFGIETVVVTEHELRGERRFPAVIEVRPSSRSEVRTRVPAFIERIVVDRVGARVRRGQVLASAFSPEVARLGDELALAGQLGPEFGGGLADGTRAGLARAGVNPDSASAGAADRRGRFAITAPRAGFLTRVAIPVGAYATPEVVLFEIADLDPVLAIASIDDAEGLAATADLHARFESGSGESLDATFDSLEPSIDPATRTRRIRFSVPNAESTLLPGTIGTLAVQSVAATRLVVPADAVLDDGSRRFVFVDRGNGVFEPRTVTTAGREGDLVGIAAGLRAGERVVARGGFLLDSESRLTAATRTLTGATDAGLPR